MWLIFVWRGILFVCMCVPKFVCFWMLVYLCMCCRLYIHIYIYLHIQRHASVIGMGWDKRRKCEKGRVVEEGVGKELLQSEWFLFLLILPNFLISYLMWIWNVCSMVDFIEWWWWWWWLKLKSSSHYFFFNKVFFLLW